VGCSLQNLVYLLLSLRLHANLATTEPPTPPTVESFGLDLSYNVPSFQSHHLNLSFDQTLGLDLAPNYDYGFPVDNGFGVDMNLGLDLMGEVEVVPRQKKKKLALVEVDRLIDGE
jgi:hypothetical protein